MRRLASWVALIAFASGLLLPPALRLHAPDDADFAPRMSGHSTTQVEPIRQATPDSHCAICHWLRALNHSIHAAPVSAPGFVEVPLAPALALHAPVRGAPSTAPARAPPASA